MSVLKLLQITFSHLNKSNVGILYTTDVRLHLDYCAQVVRPVFKQDISTLDKVQRPVPKLFEQMKHFRYCEQLKQFDFSSIGDAIRRGKGIIETYKLITGKADTESSQLFESHEDHGIRGHHLRIKKRMAKLVVRMHFFRRQRSGFMEQLPKDIVSATS